MTGDFLLLLVFVLVLGSCFFYVAEDRFDPLSLFILLYSPKILFRPALVLFDLDPVTHPWLFREDPKGLMREALIVFALATICFVAGYAAKGSAPDSLARRLPGFSMDRINGRRLRAIVILGVIASAMSITYFIVQVGSAAAFVYEARHGLFAGYYVFAKLPLVTNFLAVLLMLWSLKTGTDRLFSGLLLTASLGVTLLLGDRGGVIYPLFALLVGYHFSKKRLSTRRLGLVLVGLLALLVLTGLMRDAVFMGSRDSIAGSFEDSDIMQDSPTLGEFAKNMNVASVDHLLVVLQDFDSSNYRLGQDFYNGLIGVIPRSLWADKPAIINPGGWFRDTYMPYSGGKPYTAMGVWWINFGYVGLAIGFFLSGFACRVLWAYVRGSGFKPWAAVFYLAIFLNVTSWGVVTSTFPGAFVFWVIPLTVVYRFVLVREQRAPLRLVQPQPALTRPSS